MTLNSIINNIDLNYFKYNLGFHKYILNKFTKESTNIPDDVVSNLSKKIKLLSFINNTSPDILKYFINDDYINYVDDLSNDDLIYLLELFSKDIKEISLSVNIIVYNEERCIKRCIESIKDFADEILVLDTGSTDKTISTIKENFPFVKILEEKWRSDFSYSRNILLKQSSNDWILFLDADETATGDFNLIKQFLAIFNDFNLNGNLPLVFSPIIDSFGSKINTTKRIFNKSHKMKFDGKIHEEIISINNEKTNHILLNLTLEHDGYDPKIFKEKNKADRNTEILKKMINLEPNKIRWYYFLGREKNILGHDPEECIDILKAGLKLKHTQNSIENFYYNSLILIAKIAINTKKYDLLKEIIELIEYEIPNSLDAFYFKLILENDSLITEKYNNITALVSSVGDITTRVNTIDKSCSHILKTLGLIYLSFRDFKRAFHYFNQLKDSQSIDSIKTILSPLKEEIDNFMNKK